MLSGIQPGDLHLGNYLGAIKTWAARAEQYDCYYFMADMHTITVRQTPADLRRRTLEQLAIYIACGLDPEKNTLFVQSHVPAHAQLGWVLDCYTMFGELSPYDQFKDKSAKHRQYQRRSLHLPCSRGGRYSALSAGLRRWVRSERHCRLTRDIAKRFNGVYGDVFKIPEPFIPKEGARVMSLNAPDSKMSKSIPDGCVFLMEKPEDIMRKFKRAVTDSDTENCVRFDLKEKPGVSNLINIYAACTGKTPAEIEVEFAGQGYGAFKPKVGEAVVETLRPIREEATRLIADKAYLGRLTSRVRRRPAMSKQDAAEGLQENRISSALIEQTLFCSIRKTLLYCAHCGALFIRADRSESHQEHEGEDNEPILVFAFDEQINQHQQEQDIALVKAVQMEHFQKAIQIRPAGE